MRPIIILLFAFLAIGCQNSGTKENKASVKEIPQGTFEYELYFSEFGGRVLNASVDVVIKGNDIEVLQNDKTDLPGDKLIIKGIILKHKSGIWVIGRDESDKDSDEVGGCTDGPIPIDFDKKLIEWC